SAGNVSRSPCSFHTASRSDPRYCVQSSAARRPASSSSVVITRLTGKSADRYTDLNAPPLGVVQWSQGGCAMGILQAVMLVGMLLCLEPEADVVRLRSGKVLSGSIHLDESTKDGFALRSWDTGGTVFVRWDQLTAAEIDRVLNRSALPPRPSVESISGVRIHTNARTVVGLLVREDPDRLSIKTADSRTPVVVPKSAIIGREDQAAVPE